MINDATQKILHELFQQKYKSRYEAINEAFDHTESLSSEEKSNLTFLCKSMEITLRLHATPFSGYMAGISIFFLGATLLSMLTNFSQVIPAEYSPYPVVVTSVLALITALIKLPRIINSNKMLKRVRAIKDALEFGRVDIVLMKSIDKKLKF